MSRGYGIKNAYGQILITTVSPTQIEAMVNWLYVEAGVMPLARHKDEYIRSVFIPNAKRLGATLVEIEVKEVGL